MSAARFWTARAAAARDYANRQAKVPDCVRLTTAAVRSLSWLPPTCAYRLIDEGRTFIGGIPSSPGDPDSVHAAGISVRGRVAGPEEDFGLAALLERITDWPKQDRGSENPDNPQI